MSLQDPISDMLTRVRNALARSKETVQMPASKIKEAIAKVLRDEGYITAYETAAVKGKNQLTVTLKYYEGTPVIAKIKRASRPGLRLYKGQDALPSVLGGLGVSIISTSKGVMSDRQARAQHVGGEILCYVE